MFSSNFYMEDQNTKYIVPLDAIDLAYLPVHRKHEAIDTTVPLWRKGSRDMYLEFEVLQVNNENESTVNETKPNDEKLNITTYLKILRALKKTPETLNVIAFDEDTVVIHVQSKKLYVSVNNFQGFVKSGDETLCRVCRVVTVQKDTHVLIDKHMEIVSTYIPDINCIRKVDQLWSHCILCNEIIENIEFHITCSSEHELRLRDALCSTPVTNNKNRTENTLQSHVKGLTKLDTSQNNNVVSSYNMTHKKQESQPTVNNVQSSWATTSNNTNNRQSNVSTPHKLETIQTMSKTEGPKNKNVKLKPGMVYCDVCDRTMMSCTLKSHQGGKEHKHNLTVFKKNQVQEVKRPINNITPAKEAVNVKDNSNVCFCGTVFLSIYHKRSHFSGKIHQDYIIKQKIGEETAKTEAVNLKSVNPGTLNKTNFNYQNGPPIVKPYRTLSNRQVLCNVCNFEMHENNLQSHLKGRNHAENAMAKGTNIAQNTENNSTKTDQNKENINFKIAKHAENNKTDIPLYKVVGKEIDNDTKQLVFYSSKYTLTDCSHQNRGSSVVKVHPETKIAAAKEKSKINMKSSGNENILALKQDDESTKHNTNVFEVQSKGINKKVDFAQRNKAVENVIRNLVDKKSDIETKDPYNTETILLTNIPQGKANVKPTNTKTSVSIEENNEQINKEEFTAEKIKNLVERKNNIKVIEKYNYNCPKNNQEKPINNTGNTKTDSELQPSNTEDITENLISRNIDTNTVVKGDVSNTVVPQSSGYKSHRHELDMESNTKRYVTVSLENPNISQKTKELVNETNILLVNSTETFNLVENSAEHEIIKTNITATLNNTAETLQKDDMQSNTKRCVTVSLENPNISQKTKELVNETNILLVNSTETFNLEKNSAEHDIIKTNITATLNNTAETLQKDSKMTQSNTDSIQKDTKITYEDPNMTQNDTEPTHNDRTDTLENTQNNAEINVINTGVTPELTEQPEIENAKGTSPTNRYSFTNKLRKLVWKRRVRNTIDENLSMSTSESEILEQNEPAIKHDRKLDLGTRLRNFFSRERAKRTNEDNKQYAL